MALTIQAALQKGIEAHKAGQFEEADRFYTSVLQVQARNPDANHNMGVLAVEIGKIKESLTFFKVAVEANSSVAQFWLSFIDALIKLNQIADAKSIFEQAQKHGVKKELLLGLESRLNKKKEKIIKSMQNGEPPEKDLQLLVRLFEEKKFSTVLEKNIKLLKLFPNSAVLVNIQGATNRKLKQVDQAIANFEQALKIKPDYADAHNNLGNALKEKGDLDAAFKSFSSAIKIQPNLAEAYYNLGITLYGQGKFLDAIENYQRALTIKPDYVNALNNMGIARSSIGDRSGAIRDFRQAIKITPDFPLSYINIGNSMHEEGDLKAAIASYKMAIKFRPNYVEAYTNIGNVMHEKGEFDSAISSCQKALEISPSFFEAYKIIGNSLQSKGDFTGALVNYLKALKINPHYDKVYYNIGILLSNIRVKRDTPDLNEIILKILNKKTFVRPMNIAPCAITLLKFNPCIKTAMKQVSFSNEGKLLTDSLTCLSKVPLLLKLMTLCPLPDLEFENLFISLRSSILLNIDSLSKRTDIVPFCRALALQCYTNEYVYSQTETETDAVKALESKVSIGLKNGIQPDPLVLSILASYTALFEYCWCDLILMPDGFKELEERQILEFKKEKKYRSELNILAEITATVSSKVREQYEKNPYPRWVNLCLPPEEIELSAIGHGYRFNFNTDIIPNVQRPQILIAGCGTGQHSIETAKRFKNCDVLAIDLSLSSLAYAKRKTEELQITNITYIQADILDLGKLNRQFDLIESVGVLHHMDQPMVGWRVLTGCLKAGGIMQVGLYSELGRKDLIKIGHEINQGEVGITDFEIKSFRTGLLDADYERYKSISLMSDFYSTSELRDLIFHVQEHLFTLEQIKTCLSDLELEFCGFTDDLALRGFKKSNIGKGKPYNLDDWASYEQVNPNTFSGMYQFWCQKLL